MTDLTDGSVEKLRDETRRRNLADLAAAVKRQPTLRSTGLPDDDEESGEPSPLEKIQEWLDDISWLPDILKNIWVAIIGTSAILILLIVLGLVFAFSRGASAPSVTTVIPNATPVPAVPASPLTPTGPEVKLDADWWAEIASTSVIERSPMRLGHLDQLSMVAQVLGLALIALLFADAMPRRKSQRSVVAVAVVALIAGVATVPLLNFASVNAGWTFLVSLFLMALWATPVAAVIMHNDNTALTVALALLALTLFDLGRFALPVGLAPIFGASWSEWEGVTGIGGWLQLIMALRFGEAALTTLMFAAVIGAIWLAASEVGKKYGGWVGGVVAGLIMLVVWWIFSWLLGQGVLWLANTQDLTQTTLVVLEVLRPILAWLLSMVVATIAGVALGDVEVEFRQNRIKLGLGGSAGGWAQTTADFAVLATIFALAGVLVFVL